VSIIKINTEYSNKNEEAISVDVASSSYDRCFYPKNDIKTPAATAEPITPEILDAIQ
jgi:hypothetical protein